MAPSVGSCVSPEFCGGPSPSNSFLGSCFCDSICFELGDCCYDAGIVCPCKYDEMHILMENINLLLSVQFLIMDLHFHFKCNQVLLHHVRTKFTCKKA